MNGFIRQKIVPFIALSIILLPSLTIGANTSSNSMKKMMSQAKLGCMTCHASSVIPAAQILQNNHQHLQDKKNLKKRTR